MTTDTANPMTIRLSEEEHEFLRLLSLYWVAMGKIDKADKVAAIRKMLRMVNPPPGDTPTARQLRVAHEKMVAS